MDLESKHWCESQQVITMDYVTKRNEKTEVHGNIRLQQSLLILNNKQFASQQDNYGIWGDILTVFMFLTPQLKREIVEGGVSEASKHRFWSTNRPSTFVHVPHGNGVHFLRYISSVIVCRCLPSLPYVSINQGLAFNAKMGRQTGMWLNETKFYIMSIHQRKTPLPFAYSLNKVYL